MKHLKLVTVIAVPLLFAAGCETMGQSDKAMLEQANTNAAEAKAASMKASAEACASRHPELETAFPVFKGTPFSIRCAL